MVMAGKTTFLHFLFFPLEIPSFPEKLRVKPSKGEAGGRIEKIEQESS